jgi:hypothetical protein
MLESLWLHLQMLAVEGEFVACLFEEFELLHRSDLCMNDDVGDDGYLTATTAVDGDEERDVVEEDGVETAKA